jgi:hypothetical protein
MKIIQAAFLLLIASACATPAEVAKRKPLKTYEYSVSVEQAKVCIENGWLEEWDSTKSVQTPKGYMVFVTNGFHDPAWMATVEKIDEKTIVNFRPGPPYLGSKDVFEVLDKCSHQRP